MITHLEPDTLDCGVKWALGSITMRKTSGGDGIPVELFQILKDDAVKVLHSICQQIWETQKWPQDWKRSVFIPIPKNVQAIAQLHSSHMLAKQCLIFHARLQHSMNCELPDVPAGFRKGRGSRYQITNIC